MRGPLAHLPRRVPRSSAAHTELKFAGGRRRHACGCTTVVPPFGRREGAPATAGKVTNRQHSGKFEPVVWPAALPPRPVLPVDIGGALARACPKRVTRM